MAVAKTTASKPAAAKATRKMLTPAERVAKAEAELARLRTQAVERDSKTAKSIDDKVAKLNAEIKVRQDKVEALNVQRAALTVPVTDPELLLEDSTDEQS